MREDFIPRSDAEFDAWQKNLLGYAVKNQAAMALNAPDLAAMTSLQTDWETKYAAHITAQSAARGAREAKDESREAYEESIRGLNRTTQASASVTDENRIGMGLPPATRDAPTPVPTPTTRPVVSVDTSERLRHIISWVDESTPNRKAKPHGVIGCQVWNKVGAQPAGPSDLEFVIMDPRSPYIIEYEDAEAGKTAYYMLRWVNSRGETGPWSQTVSATITA
jgi:hypothetical protein